MRSTYAIYGEAFFERELEPVTARHSIARPALGHYCKIKPVETHSHNPKP